MNEINGVLSETINQTHHWLYYQAPKLAFALGILVLGWLVAKIVKSASVKVMKAVKLDTLAKLFLSIKILIKRNKNVYDMRPSFSIFNSP